MNILNALQGIENNEFMRTFKDFYGTAEEELKYQKQRYLDAVNSFAKLYPKRKDIRIFSAPGRTEIGGNHTDHQHGCVLAASVNLDIIAVAGFHNEGVIRIKSEGYDSFTVSLNDLSVHHNEKNTAAIVRGIVSRFSKMGVKIDGFDIYCTSDVLSGSGISSSAAFEILIGTIINSYYNSNRADAVQIAKIGQFSENIYFGKKSGLMDQMVSSVGGLVSIDFYDTQNPEIERFDFDFEEHGYCLCITDTKGSHANLTDDYVAIRSEMESVAAYFGKEALREVSEAELLENAKPGFGGEIQLTDALSMLAAKQDIYAYDFVGQRYDVGNKMGFLKATVEQALRRDDLKEEFLEYLKTIVGENK